MNDAPTPPRPAAQIARGILAAVSAGSIAALLGPIAAPLHDGIGRWVRGPALSVLVVTIEGDLAAGAARAQAAGATEVVAALPPGHPWLGGVAPEPPGLRTDRAGRVRWFGALRLPLPEALPRLARVRAEQIDPSDPTQLAGRRVVLEPADPAAGLQVLAPGVPGPIDRAMVLATALGAADAQAGLRAPGPAWTGLATAFAAAGFGAWLRRQSLGQGSLAAAVAAGAWIAGCIAARTAGFDLPLEAVVGAIGVPLGLRAMTVTERALTAVDRLAARLAPPRPTPPRRAGLVARAEMLGWLASDRSIALWTLGFDGQVTRTPICGREGDLPQLEALPAEPIAWGGWRVVPVTEGGLVVGALGLAGPAPPTPADIRLLDAVATAPLDGPERAIHPPSDPLTARLQVVFTALDRTLSETETWRAILGPSGLSLGLFALGGDVIAASAPLTQQIDPEATNPLASLLTGWTGADPRTALLRAVSGDEVRLQTANGQQEVVLRRLDSPTGPRGLLVQLHDVAPHQRLDQLRADLWSSTNARIRNGLLSVSGYADLLAEGEADEREALLVRLQARIDGIVGELDKAEGLTATRAGDQPLQPVFLSATVRSAWERLDPARRGRVQLQVPDISAPIRARAQALEAALEAVLSTFSDHGAGAALSVQPEPQSMALTLVDDSGGLPPGMLDRLLDPRADSALGRGLRALAEMGCTWTSSSDAGAGVRIRFDFPYF